MSRVSCFVRSGLMLGLTAVVSNAQSRSSSNEVKTFQVITVNGNDLVVKLPEGTREIDVPPGMSGTATITTTTAVTPVVVTEVGNGTVALVSGTSVYVRTPQGVKPFSQSELDKRGVKLFVDGSHER